MKDVHDRMPVTVSADQVRAYLTDYEAARELIAAPAPRLCKEPAE